MSGLVIPPQVPRLVHVDDREVRLSETEAHILGILLNVAPMYVLTTSLASYLYGDPTMLAAVRTHIARLRARLDPGCMVRFIESGRGGYRAIGVAQQREEQAS